VSTGLLHNMSEDEAEAVLGHEIAHVANGDMITMALLQGVLNTFVIVLARVVGGIIDSALSGNREGGAPAAYYIIVFVLEMVFGLFATMISMWFSRHREFRADAGGASLAGRQKMIAALERLQLNHGQSTLPTQIAAFGIAGSTAKKLFMSHPPLEEPHRRAAGVDGGVSLRTSTVVQERLAPRRAFLFARCIADAGSCPADRFRACGEVSLSLLVQSNQKHAARAREPSRTPVPCAPRPVEGRNPRCAQTPAPLRPRRTCGARLASRRTGQDQRQSIHAWRDLLGAAVAFDLGSALSEPSIAGMQGRRGAGV
jgi:hypothetical protein